MEYHRAIGGASSSIDTSQQHILGFAINIYNYILVKKDICD
jgi:hypothetical protein